ncbi:MAG: DUF4174 domain-containing protein [Planktomarina sp.]
MKKLMFALTLLAGPAFAETTVDDWRQNPAAPIAAADINISDFKWQARPVIVFADSRFDPAFIQQMEYLAEGERDLIDRDIVWIVDTDTVNTSDLRQKLRPHGFGMVLIGKDGGVKLRNALPWDLREISRVIDKMPMRQLEVEERRGNQMDLSN